MAQEYYAFHFQLHCAKRIKGYGLKYEFNYEQRSLPRDFQFNCTIIFLRN